MHRQASLFTIKDITESLPLRDSARYLADQPLLPHPALTDRHLLLFAFEDWLKKWFFSILQILEVRLSPPSCFGTRSDF